MSYLSHFEIRPDLCGGETVIRGTGVTLRTVLASLAEGGTVDDILADCPTLSASDLPAVIAFADVDSVMYEGLRGRPDPDVWKDAQAAGRLLMTQDLDFSDIRQFLPGTHAGLLLVAS